MNTSTPQDTPHTPLPLVLHPNAIRGYHYKFWIAPAIAVIVLSIIVMNIAAPSFTLLVAILLPLGWLPVALIIMYNVKTKSVTLYEDRVEVKNGKDQFTIPFTKLDKVRRGYEAISATSYGAVRVTSTELQKSYTLTALHYSLKDMQRFYEAIPAAHRDDRYTVRDRLGIDKAETPQI